MRWRFALGACALAAGIAALAYAFWPAGSRTLTAGAFRLSYPSSWQVVPAARLARLPDHPVAVLARKDGRGRVTITRDVAQPRLDGPRLVKQVNADFSERLEDFRLLSAAIEQTRAGSIFVYSYRPPGVRAVHTVALVPAGDHSFLLSTVAGPGAADAAEQIAGIIRSFRPR